jgi:hypothetical protein
MYGNANYDILNGLIGIGRDAYLKIVQYMSPEITRKYIGICEKTFGWSGHIHFTIYRLKDLFLLMLCFIYLECIPLKKIIIPQRNVIFLDRTLVFLEDCSIVLRNKFKDCALQIEIIFDDSIVVSLVHY